MNKIKYTRADYLNNLCSHRQYYAQFVTESIKGLVKRYIGIDKLLKSKDKHLNDIPLNLWDNLPIFGVSEKLKARGDYLTLSNKVCIYKEAAKQLIEDYKK